MTTNPNIERAVAVLYEVWMDRNAQEVMASPEEHIRAYVDRLVFDGLLADPERDKRIWVEGWDGRTSNVDEGLHMAPHPRDRDNPYLRTEAEPS